MAITFSHAVIKLTFIENYCQYPIKRESKRKRAKITINLIKCLIFVQVIENNWPAISISTIKHCASNSFIVRVETNLNHFICGSVTVDRILASLVEMLQCNVWISTEPVMHRASVITADIRWNFVTKWMKKLLRIQQAAYRQWCSVSRCWGIFSWGKWKGNVFGVSAGFVHGNLWKVHFSCDVG